jgi:hypothetical protein
LIGGLALLGLAAATGCPSVSGTDFEQLISQLTGGTYVNPANTVTIRLINEAESGTTETLILEIDGVQQTFTCSATQNVTTTVLSACPTSIIAISENRVDSSGAFVGGRLFNGSDESFNFTEGEFSCGEIVTYSFTETEASAYVY